jgi:hypothetical protein
MRHKEIMNEKGFVYAVRAVTVGRIKIGYSIDPESRLGNLQIGSPDILEIIATWPGTEDGERSLHKHLSQWRTHGEWFESSEVVWDTIKHCHAKQKTDLKGIDLTAAQCVRRVELQAQLQGSCCFCGKVRNEVYILVANRGVWICEPCIEFCSGALFDQRFKAA